MARLILPRQPTAGAGVAVTFQGRCPNQGVLLGSGECGPGHWREEGLARGSLKWQRTRTNGAGQSVNFYFAPSIKRLIERIRVRAV